MLIVRRFLSIRALFVMVVLMVVVSIIREGRLHGKIFIEFAV
jgi:hypothetical protein